MGIYERKKGMSFPRFSEGYMTSERLKKKSLLINGELCQDKKDFDFRNLKYFNN